MIGANAIGKGFVVMEAKTFAVVNVAHYLMTGWAHHELHYFFCHMLARPYLLGIARHPKSC